MMNLLLRVDASARIGTGHVMRCLALAQAWQEKGGRATFVMTTETPAVEARLASEGMQVTHLVTQPGSPEDAQQTVGLAQQREAVWIVVDGYYFGADYQQTIKRAGLRLLFVDDYGHAGHYYADLVLNQNIYANESLYPKREPHTRLLLGTEYVLLRREFWSWRGWRREVPPVARKVLIMMGGSDSDNVTLKIIRAMQKMQVDGLEAIVAAGGNNPNVEELQAEAERSECKIQVERDVVNMPDLMAWADVAVSAGGSTCWELAFMSVPFIVITTADNQRLVCEELAEFGVAQNLGWFENIRCTEIAHALTELLRETDSRTRMAMQGKILVDGRGSQRVVKTMRHATACNA